MTSNIGEPFYSEPPLVEVSVSAQFEPIEEIHLGYLGLIWEIYKDRYPQVEHIEELPHSIEKFGVIQRDIPRFQFQQSMPFPRMRLTSVDNKNVIQIQKDRFVFNWRRDKSSASEYPRFDSIKSKFLTELEGFILFLEKYNLPSLNFNQAELTYVNHIDAEQNSVQEVFRDYVKDPNYSDNLELEHFSIKFRHIITEESKKIGRLYTSIDKGNLISDNSSIYILNFTARSHPLDSSLEGMINVMDIMRSTINNSFTAITSITMHKNWNKE
jgi:uncharacterized protein (TIGR04255 family)